MPVLPKQGSPHWRGAKFSHSSRLSESKTYHHMARTSRWENFNIGLCCIAKGSTLARGAQAGSLQRMKWSDSMVRLLITVVLYVGEDGGSECEDGSKKKSGILQKKGKWKSVSKVMMGKGCYVSLQQCEDKFNDLNKRYKRLNDILGRGITCRVVENPRRM